MPLFDYLGGELDGENRITAVSGADTATFVYDGDGNKVRLRVMVQATRNGVTTTYIGSYFEWENNDYTKYYYAGSQRFAMRTNQSGSDVLQYILSDHLGSTSTSVDVSGDYVARTGYMPWGGERYTTADIPTDYRYTGQRLEDDLGIYFYNARWYDPSIGRFLQADTIVPDPGNPLAYDRYAYVLNNPLRYTDPSGHFTEDEMCEYWGYCGENAKEELGALFDVMWNTSTTWGDIALLENMNGTISSAMFMLFTTNTSNNCGYWGGLWDLNRGTKFNQGNGNLGSNITNAVGYHLNSNGTIDYPGTIARGDVENWLTENGITIPSSNSIRNVPNNSDNFSLGKYTDIDGLWWTDVMVGLAAMFVSPQFSAATESLAIAGWVLDGFGSGHMDGPIDATYPVATHYYDYYTRFHGANYILFNAPEGMYKK